MIYLIVADSYIYHYILLLIMFHIHYTTNFDKINMISGQAENSLPVYPCITETKNPPNRAVWRVFIFIYFGFIGRMICTLNISPDSE